MKKIPKTKKFPFLTAAKASLIILTVIFSVIIIPMAGAGLIYNSDSYGISIRNSGIALIASGLIMTVSSVLACLRKNIAALILDSAGFTLCMTMLFIVMNHADSSGWSDNYTMEPVSGMYFRRIFPVIIPFILTAVISIAQHLSPKSAKSRQEKKRLREEKENQPAPPIL